MIEQKKKNAMKKKITFGMVAFAMVAASAVFMKSIAKDDLSAMIQANVDALTVFEWDGTLWNEDDNDHWFGSDWKPVLSPCQYSSGIDVGIEIAPGITVDISKGDTINGYIVTCNDGDGNCFNGSDCTNV